MTEGGLSGGRTLGKLTALAASSATSVQLISHGECLLIRFVIASGCEISARWLALISIVFAPIRLAVRRSRSGSSGLGWARHRRTAWCAKQHSSSFRRQRLVERLLNRVENARLLRRQVAREVVQKSLLRQSAPIIVGTLVQLMPFCWRRAMILDQQEPSANRPCTKTAFLVFGEVWAMATRLSKGSAALTATAPINVRRFHRSFLCRLQPSPSIAI
jgi:hypothetical protein